MAKAKSKQPAKEESSDGESPMLSPVDSDEEDSSVYDSGLGENDESEEEFEDQGSSDDEDDRLERQQEDDESDDGIAIEYEKAPRSFSKRSANGATKEVSEWMHADDLSSDDEDPDGQGNRIGKVPLHWYEDLDHVGYNAHGTKVAKQAGQGGDRVDQALAMDENMRQGKYVVYDAVNDRNVELTPRQLELIRRVQSGAYAHPEHEAEPDYVDYYSGILELSGLNSDKYEPKARFQPSKWEKLQVDRLLEKLERGVISLDYLKGGNEEKEDPDKPKMLWKGDEDDLLNMGKGPQHIAAPKQPPPTHAASYRPPDEYLPTEEDLKQWEELEPKDRPHGLMIPKKFENLRSVGAYQHAVREAFERCLDLYLCPRQMKRRLNIDPESLVPRLPKASDLKPYPVAKCIEYKTPYEGEEAPMIRCITASPDGQFMASGATDGYVRLWEVETGRILQSWDIASTVNELLPSDDKATTVVRLEWNPNRSHHCLLAAIGKCVVVISTETGNEQDKEVTEALLSSACAGGNVSNEKARKAVSWKSTDSHTGPVCVLTTSQDISCVRWHARGDYFVSVAPKAGAAAVLIHQLSKGNSQQPFSKAKGETQQACFHPSKPFLFVANQQHVRVYHLVKQTMVKRLVSGCRWISSLDVHSSGDHLLVGSLDRRLVWFDLDLGSSPYKTLKYHERALRSGSYHSRYPLMASSSDDGTVHVFHSMIYSDLMRNPLVVPVKILRGHQVTRKLGVLATCWHPQQPWIFTAGADGKIFLYQDI